MDDIHQDCKVLSLQLNNPDSMSCCGSSQARKLICQHHLTNDSTEQISSIPRTRTSSISLRKNPSQTVLSQKYILLEMLKDTFGSGTSLNSRNKGNFEARTVLNKEQADKAKQYNRKTAEDNLSTVLSTFYAKFIVVLGIAFPVTDILSIEAPPSFYQGFYLYLYLVSVTFVIFVYIAHLRTKFIFSSIETYSSVLQNSYQQSSQQNSFHYSYAKNDSNQQQKHQGNFNYIYSKKPIVRYGSFYLRMGAVAFGIGSMVYSGLEFGQYFELRHDSRCENLLIIFNPAARMLLTLVQMHFIFLNTKDLSLRNHKCISRFGLMHMIATNLCEWLYVLVEETKHEIVHIAHKKIDDLIIERHENISSSSSSISIAAASLLTNVINNGSHHILTKRATSLEIVVECRRTNIMGNLVQNASYFLFPCTIEYSLICAVTLFEMWKCLRGLDSNTTNQKMRKTSTTSEQQQQQKGAHYFSVDCSRAYQGMFGGILIIVLTIISLVIYFELSTDTAKFQDIGLFGICITESTLFTITIFAVCIAMYKMRDLRYSKCYNMNQIMSHQQSLDCNLLIVAQSGIYIYAMFSIVGSYFSLNFDSNGIYGLINEILSLIQTSLQTLFILNAWWRRCRSSKEIRTKPGRESITFLLVANISLWSINSLIKNRAAFRPTHLQFFGQWAWTVITHISMPLAIFYRLHSTICLFEIWKKTYKVN